MKTLLSFTITLAPLIFGLAAWALAGFHCFSKNRKPARMILSWCFCAIALWFPLQAIHRWVEHGDISSILDCVGAYFLCATVLLAGNLLLSLLGLLKNRKQN